jgi:hypothetical protein
MPETYYAAEKGKYGLFTGCVVPFPRFLSGNSPGGADFKQYVPSGFLRCNGAKFRGSDYPVLAEILGMGASSRFKKDNVELEEPSSDLNFGQFQVPDLGAKYVNASNISGGFNNLYATASDGTQIPTCGVPVEVLLNQGDEVSVFYEGNFQVGATDIFIPSAMNFVSTLSPVAPAAEVPSLGYLPHAHFSEVSCLRGGVQNTDAIITSASGFTGGNLYNNAQGGPTISLSEVTGTDESTNHVHFFKTTSLTRTTDFVLRPIALSSAFLTTTVNLKNEQSIKFDDIQHKYTLVEWLIKF